MKAFAQVTIPDPASVLPGWKISSLGQVVSEFLRYALVFGGLAMFVFLIMGGFKLLTSAGDSAKVKEGTDNIIYHNNKIPFDYNKLRKEDSKK